MELEGGPKASLQAAKLLASFRAKGLPLVHIQAWCPTGPAPVSCPTPRA